MENLLSRKVDLISRSLDADILVFFLKIDNSQSCFLFKSDLFIWIRDKTKIERIFSQFSREKNDDFSLIVSQILNTNILVAPPLAIYNTNVKVALSRPFCTNFKVASPLAIYLFYRNIKIWLYAFI